MGCSLSIHNKGYQIAYSDAALSFATGFSGAHYALRHWELGSFSHKAICAIECVPILGGIVALIERIAFVLSRKPFADVPWRVEPFHFPLTCILPSPLHLQKDWEKMKDNLIEANKVHEGSPGFANVSDIDFTPVTLRETFSFTHHAADKQGLRPTMEDAHFYKELGDKGILAGVFDGHGGADVAAYASQEVEKRFPEALEAANRNVQYAFELLIHQIHREIVENANWNSQGSTAVICYIDKETNIAYTATVGDAEVHLYRKIGYRVWRTTKAIALSLVENWLSPDALKRLMNFHGPHNFKMVADPKQLRSQIDYGVNVSNAIGDVDQTGTVAKPLVTHRPSVTALHLERGDQIVLACDGLWDFGKEVEIAAIVAENQGTTNAQGPFSHPFKHRVYWCEIEANNLAQKLVDYAITSKGSTDNVSVLTIGVA